MTHTEMQEAAIGVAIGVILFALTSIIVWNSFITNFHPTADLSWLF